MMEHQLGLLDTKGDTRLNSRISTIFNGTNHIYVYINVYIYY